MRYIPYHRNKIIYPIKWGENFNSAWAAILDSSTRGRAKEINRHSIVWSSLKPVLKEFFFDKCWYTESNICGTDGAVDHFRPKNRVSNTKSDLYGEHKGYWWLAFSPNNYRFSCTYANSKRKNPETDITGGKGDEFPIYTDTTRAWQPLDNINNEDNLLIDPCVRSDVELITFKPDCEAMPRYKKEDNRFFFEKADKSILFYNINHTDFVKARRKIKTDLDEYIEEAEFYYLKLELGASAERGYELALQRIEKACRYDSEYSRFSIDYITQFRHKEFLQAIFQ